MNEPQLLLTLIGLVGFGVIAMLSGAAAESGENDLLLGAFTTALLVMTLAAITLFLRIIFTLAFQ